MTLTKQEEAAFRAAGEPRSEPDYTEAALRLRQTLSPQQEPLFIQTLDAVGALIRFERRWYFRKGYRAAKKETP